MEFDHLFVCTQKGAPEVDLFRSLGISEGPANTHPGQGTANRRFFFKNAMVEFLWLSDASEAQSELTAPTGLFERCSLSSGASPFGFCFRPNKSSETNAAFPHWSYKPIYLPPPLQIDMADAPLSEPLWFFLAFSCRPDHSDTYKDQPFLNHSNGIDELTAIHVSFPFESGLSDAARIVSELENFAVSKNNEHLLELEFDKGRQNNTHDFRPALPLIVRW